MKKQNNSIRSFVSVVCGVGALIAYLTKGAGAHAAVCASLAIGIIGITVTTSLSENWGEENARKWCPQSFD